MHLDAGAIERDGLDFDADDLLLLQLLEYSTEHSARCPTVHAGVDGTLVAEAFGQPTPLATMLGNVQDGVKDLQVGKAEIAALARHAVFNFGVLSLGDFHHHNDIK